MQIKTKFQNIILTIKKMKEQKTIGDYIVDPITIGQGSFGKVYKAYHQKTKQVVAIKYIEKKGKSAKEVEGFRAEMQIMRKIDHPNIISFKEVFETDIQLIIVMEFAGTDLSQIMKKRKKLPYQEVKDISYQILEALLHLKEHRIVHRDLKPQNILVEKGVVKLCDFGFAKQMSASNAFVHSIKGTPLYIAPEIVRQKPYSYKVDIWSFGIIIYELYVGKQPFFANVWSKLIPIILNERVQYPKDIPPELKLLIAGMLEKNPNHRYDWDQVRKNSVFKELMDENLKVSDKSPMKIVSEAKSEKENKVPKEIYRDLSPIKEKYQENIKIQETDQYIFKEIEGIEARLTATKEIPAELKRLRTDENFYFKLMGILSSKINQPLSVPKQILAKTLRILVSLINKVKVSQSHEGDDDITKNISLVFSVIKIGQKEDDQELLAQELNTLGFLLKNNFNHMAVDTETDDQSVKFVLSTLRRKEPLSKKCFTNCFKIFGILANQAMATLSNSDEFFEKCAEDKALVEICQYFQPKKVQSGVILELIEKFIHPTFPVNRDQDFILTPRLIRIFTTLREQVAQILFQKGFICSDKSPFEIYLPTEIDYYFRILYQCLKISKEMRIRYMEMQDFWCEMIDKKKLKVFFLAYNDIIVSEEKVNLLKKQIVQSQIIIQEGKQNDLVKVFLLKLAYFNYEKKNDSRAKIENGRKILLQISELFKTEQSLKKKAVKELQGTLKPNYCLFDEYLINMMCDIMQNQKQLIGQLVNEKENQPIGGLTYDRLLFSCLPQEKDSEKSILNISEKTLLKYLSHVSCETELTKNRKFLTAVSGIFLRIIAPQRIRSIEELEGKRFLFKLLTKFLELMMIILPTGTNSDQTSVQLLKACEENQLQRTLFDVFQDIVIHDGIKDQKSVKLFLEFMCRIVSTNPSQRPLPIVDFIGFQVMPSLSRLIQNPKTQQDILSEIITLISAVCKFRVDFSKAIQELHVIEMIPRFLTSKNEALIQKTLNMVGNLSKHNTALFPEFQKNKIIVSIRICLQIYNSNKKILKNGIYAIGNISYYNDKFSSYIIPLIPLFIDALSSDDDHLLGNGISTLSNLVRHSSVYIPALLNHEIIQKVLKEFVIQIQITKENRSDKGKLVQQSLNFIKKCLNFKDKMFRSEQGEEIKKLLREAYKTKKDTFPEDECLIKIHQIFPV